MILKLLIAAIAFASLSTSDKPTTSDFVTWSTTYSPGFEMSAFGPTKIDGSNPRSSEYWIAIKNTSGKTMHFCENIITAEPTLYSASGAALKPTGTSRVYSLSSYRPHFRDLPPGESEVYEDAFSLAETYKSIEPGKYQLRVVGTVEYDATDCTKFSRYETATMAVEVR